MVVRFAWRRKTVPRLGEEGRGVDLQISGDAEAIGRVTTN